MAEIVSQQPCPPAYGQKMNEMKHIRGNARGNTSLWYDRRKASHEPLVPRTQNHGECRRNYMAPIRTDRAGSTPLRAGAQTENASPIWRGAGHRVVSSPLVAVAEMIGRSSEAERLTVNQGRRWFDSSRPSQNARNDRGECRWNYRLQLSGSRVRIPPCASRACSSVR